jgi:hypothetical protein
MLVRIASNRTATSCTPGRSASPSIFARSTRSDRRWGASCPVSSSTRSRCGLHPFSSRFAVSSRLDSPTGRTPSGARWSVEEVSVSRPHSRCSGCCVRGAAVASSPSSTPRHTYLVVSHRAASRRIVRSSATVSASSLARARSGCVRRGSCSLPGPCCRVSWWCGPPAVRHRGSSPRAAFRTTRMARPLGRSGLGGRRLRVGRDLGGDRSSSSRRDPRARDQSAPRRAAPPRRDSPRAPGVPPRHGGWARHRAVGPGHRPRATRGLAQAAHRPAVRRETGVGMMVHPSPTADVTIRRPWQVVGGSHE